MVVSGVLVFYEKSASEKLHLYIYNRMEISMKSSFESKNGGPEICVTNEKNQFCGLKIKTNSVLVNPKECKILISCREWIQIVP